MKIKEDHPNENKERLFLQSLLSQGSQPLSLVFGATPRQAGKWESFIVKEGKASGLFRSEAVGLRKLEADQLEVDSYVVALGSIPGSLSLGPRWKWRQKLEKLTCY